LGVALCSVLSRSNIHVLLHLASVSARPDLRT
jgi:hypothetical protein